ncbi:MAG: helix-turn-helix transcriptional regulator [Acutalibacter sp.]|nr:MAG TPA: Helix-turn-helix XRE-family like protein [Caudoviricetes sp.]
MSKPMTFDEYLAKEMENPEFKAEWDALEPEFQIIRGIVEGREMNDLTQEQLSAATGINQANISRLENGTANPSLRTLKRLAAGMGMALKIEFVPLRPAGQ